MNSIIKKDVIPFPQVLIPPDESAAKTGFAEQDHEALQDCGTKQHEQHAAAVAPFHLAVGCTSPAEEADGERAFLHQPPPQEKYNPWGAHLPSLGGLPSLGRTTITPVEPAPAAQHLPLPTAPSYQHVPPFSAGGIFSAGGVYESPSSTARPVQYTVDLGEEDTTAALARDAMLQARDERAMMSYVVPAHAQTLAIEIEPSPEDEQTRRAEAERAVAAWGASRSRYVLLVFRLVDDIVRPFGGSLRSCMLCWCRHLLRPALLGTIYPF